MKYDEIYGNKKISNIKSGTAFILKLYLAKFSIEKPEDCLFSRVSEQ